MSERLTLGYRRGARRRRHAAGTGRHRAARPRVPLLEPRARGRRAATMSGRNGETHAGFAVATPARQLPAPAPRRRSRHRRTLRRDGPRCELTHALVVPYVPCGNAPSAAAVYGKPVRVRRGPATVTGERPLDLPPETPGRRGRAKIREPGDRLRRRRSVPRGRDGTDVGRGRSRPRRSRARHARSVARPARGRPRVRAVDRRSTPSDGPSRSSARPRPRSQVERLVFDDAPRRRPGGATATRPARLPPRLDRGEHVAFATLGDPNIYSTFSVAGARGARPVPGCADRDRRRDHGVPGAGRPRRLRRARRHRDALADHRARRPRRAGPTRSPTGAAPSPCTRAGGTCRPSPSASRPRAASTAPSPASCSVSPASAPAPSTSSPTRRPATSPPCSSRPAGRP